MKRTWKEIAEERRAVIFDLRNEKAELEKRVEKLMLDLESAEQATFMKWRTVDDAWQAVNSATQQAVCVLREVAVLARPWLPDEDDR